MPMTTVTAKLRMNATRSPRRMAQTAELARERAQDQEDRGRAHQRQDLERVLELLRRPAASAAFARTLK